VSKFAISARHFVVSAGAIHSSALLLRTHDLQRQSECGRVCLQPHATVHALFDAPVTGGFPEGGGERSVPSSGVPAVYNFTGMLRDRGYGWFASALHPASLATATAHLSPSDQLDLISRFHHTSSISITVRDHPDRSRIQMRNGRATLDYLESASDRRSLRRCLADVSRGLLAVGARRVFLPLLNPPGIEHVGDVDAVERMDLSFDRVLLYADHLSGGNPVGATSEQGVTDSNGRVFGSRNIHVADASLLPSACGVGPSWTIMALSRSVALSLVADCSIVQGSSPQRSPAGQRRNPPSSTAHARIEDEARTVAQVCGELVRHPVRSLIYRWHWKNAIASAAFRSVVFFVGNLAGGHQAAWRAGGIEFVLRIPLVGMLAAAAQSFRTVEPAWAATCVAAVTLPAIAIGVEFVVHSALSTPELLTSVGASIACSVLSTTLTLFLTRRGVMVVDGGSQAPLANDLRRLPRLLVEYALALPRAVARRFFASSLLPTQDRDRIDACGAARRDPAGEQRDDGEQRRDRRVDRRLRRADREEKVF